MNGISMPYPCLRRPVPVRIGLHLAALAWLMAGSCLLSPGAFAQGTPPAPAASAHPAAPTPANAPAGTATSRVAAGAAAQTPAAGAAAAGGAARTPAAGTPAAGSSGATSAPAAPAAAAAEPQTDTRGLDQEVQDLKKDVVDLNRDLFVLEEELLFPANTQVAVFLSMDVGDFFALDSVTLKIDQKEVINYLYTPREVDALLKGGVHRLYLGNLKVGQHELVAFFSGKGPNQRDYRRGATIKFEKGIGAKYLELKINDRQRRQQPEFEIKDWE